jgi:hypothetical protein
VSRVLGLSPNSVVPFEFCIGPLLPCIKSILLARPVEVEGSNDIFGSTTIVDVEAELVFAWEDPSP